MTQPEVATSPSGPVQSITTEVLTSDKSLAYNSHVPINNNQSKYVQKIQKNTQKIQLQMSIYTKCLF